MVTSITGGYNGSLFKLNCFCSKSYNIKVIWFNAISLPTKKREGWHNCIYPATPGQSHILPYWQDEIVVTKLA